MTIKEKLHMMDPFKSTSCLISTDETKPTITPLFPQQNTIEIKYENLEVKASGYAIEGINEIIKTIYSNCGVPQTTLKGNVSNPKSVSTNYQKDASKGRIAEINNPDREKPLDIHVDLLKDKVRLPRMAEGFRCPSCGQGFITKAVSSNGTQQMFIFRNANVNTGEQKANIGKVNIEGINVENRENKEELITLYKGLSELTFEPVSLLYQEGTNCHCPICNEEHTLMDWIDAFTSPLNYFDREMICDICGDDAKLVMTDSTQYTECENNCISKTVNKEKITEDKCPNSEDCNDTCCDSCADESCDDCCGNKE